MVGASFSCRTVYSSHIGAKLAHVPGLQLTGLDFYHHVTVQLYVIKQKVKKLLGFTDHEAILAPQQCKPVSQFQQEVLDIVHQSILQFLLIVLLPDRQKIEEVRIAGHLLRQVALWFRQCRLEIVDRVALTLIKPGVQEVEQHIPRPVVLQCFLRIESRNIRLFSILIYQQLNVTPRN